MEHSFLWWFVRAAASEHLRSLPFNCLTVASFWCHHCFNSFITSVPACMCSGAGAVQHHVNIPVHGHRCGLALCRARKHGAVPVYCRCTVMVYCRGALPCVLSWCTFVIVSYTAAGCRALFGCVVCTVGPQPIILFEGNSCR